MRVAGDARGDLAIVADEATFRGGERDVLYLTRKPAGQRLGRQVAIARGGRITAVAIQLDARGDALVAWARDRRVEARWITAGGRPRPVASLGSSEPAPTLALGVGSDRRATVLWESQLVDAQAAEPHVPGSGLRVDAAFAAAGGRFGTRLVLETSNSGRALLDCSRGVDGLAGVSYLGGTVPEIAWTGIQGNAFVVRAASAPFGPGQSQIVSNPTTDSCLGGVAASGTGAVALAFAENVGGRLSPFAALRGPANASFRSPEALGGPALSASQAEGVGAPRIAADPLGGRFAVVWTSVDGVTHDALSTATGG